VFKPLTKPLMLSGAAAGVVPELETLLAATAGDMLLIGRFLFA
jgi:hypothetical protein